MLWKAIIKGTAIFFSQREIWLAMLAYWGLMLLYYLGVSTHRRRTGDQPTRPTAGLLGRLIAPAVVQGVLVVCMIPPLFIILLGGQDFAPWPFLGVQGSGLALRALLVCLGMTVVLGFVPVAGRWIRHAPGIILFVQAAIAVRVIMPVFMNDVLSTLPPELSTDALPGIWTSASFAVISFVLIHALTMGLRSLFPGARSTWEDRERRSTVASSILGVVPGLWLLCVYSSYATLRMEALVLGPAV